MRIIFIDVESTGLDIWGSEILTLYAIKTIDLEIIEEGLFCFRPETWLPRYEESVKIHGINKLESLTFPDKRTELLRLLVWLEEEFIIYCHANKNNMGATYAFDYAILDKEFSIIDAQDDFRKAVYPCKGFSTHSLAMLADRNGIISVPSTIKDGNKKFSKDFSLKGLCNLFKIKLSNHHDAKVDSHACYAIFKHIYNINPRWVTENIKEA